VSEAARQPQSSSTNAERERQELVAAIEEGLADLDAGRSYTHAEVLAEMRRRFPSPSK